MNLDNEVQILTAILPGVHFAAQGIGIIGQKLSTIVVHVLCCLFNKPAVAGALLQTP